MAADFFVHLLLDVENPDLSGLDELIDSPRYLDALAAAVARAEQPYPWAAQHVLHAIDHLRAADFLDAWPPLVIGVEGLHWAVAEKKGLIDPEGKFTTESKRTGAPRSVIDVLKVLPINDRVARFIGRFGFCSDGNAMRHGRLHDIDPRQQCLVWLVALCAWLDGNGWVFPESMTGTKT